MLHVVVAYDIIDDRRRNKIAKFLTGFLDRVQKSVFEGKIREKRYDLMEKGIEKIIDQTEDTVRIYYLCARCGSAGLVLGTGLYIEEEEREDKIL